MGEFFGLFSACFSGGASVIGILLLVLVAVPLALLLLLSPLISFVLFCSAAYNLLPLRKRDLSKYSKEMQEALSERYHKKEAERRREMPITVIFTILFLIQTIVCTLGVILYFQSN